ncbi:ABC transporter permease [Roseburia hominis]
MTVYKGYLKLWSKELHLVLLYFVIFMFVGIMMQSAAAKKQEQSYASEKLDIAVIDQDGGELARGLGEYLGEIHQLQDIGGKKEDLQVALFYRKVKYVVTIPENFEKEFLENGAKLKTTKVPGSEQDVYLNSQIDTFLNGVRTYVAGGYSVSEAVGRVKSVGSQGAKVKMIANNENAGMKADYVYWFQYFPYVILASLGYSSGVLISFRRKEIQQRMNCSSKSLIRQNLEGVLAFMTIGGMIWLLCTGAVVAMSGKRFWESANVGYFLLNSILMMLVALSIAYLVGVAAAGKGSSSGGNSNSLSAVVNVISLGMSFLCGVFVPLEVLGKEVKMVAQFLPVYWYEVINEMLGDFDVLTPEMLGTLWKGFAIELAFAGACVVLALGASPMERKMKM